MSDNNTVAMNEQLEAISDIHEFGVIGGNIEGPYGSRYCKHFICTAHVLDVVNPDVPLVSVVDGKHLHDLNEITVEHQKHAKEQNIGPLKESIVSGVKSVPLFNSAVIRYYLDRVIPKNETFHVHIHRGKTTGQAHIDEIKRELNSIDEKYVKDERLSFGFGYELNQLQPPKGTVDWYYSVSMIIGFNPRCRSGDVYIPLIYTEFTTPPQYTDTPISHNPNLMIWPLPHIIDYNVTVGGKIAVLKGIFIPDDPTKNVKCNYRTDRTKKHTCVAYVC